MLELQHIHKYYNPGTVNEMCLFEDFNLSIKKGQFVSVVGSNGSGKTSMLNIVCGSINPDSGKILIEGQDITKEKEYRRLRRIGRVYQNPAMGTCPNMTILENMSMADHKGKFFGLSMGTNKSRIPFYQEQLRQLNLGLEDKLHVKVGSLSGGQRQDRWSFLPRALGSLCAKFGEYCAVRTPPTLAKPWQLGSCGRHPPDHRRTQQVGMQEAGCVRAARL